MKKIYERITAIRGGIVTVRARSVGLGEMAQIYKQNGDTVYASVLKIEGDKVFLQAFENTRGLKTSDRVVFLGKQIRATISEKILGRRFNGSGVPIDKGELPVGEEVEVNSPACNPVRRIVPRELVRTNIPMIDLFNCLVKSQKIPIFSVAGEPFNPLLMRIANQTDVDIVIIGGMGLRFDDYQSFVENAEISGSIENTIMYIHLATDPAIECILVPDMALAAAEWFAVRGKDVLVLLSDMTAYADALKEISITMDQIPSNRGYPGSLYSDLAAKYEKAVDFDGAGSITILSATTMPGGDITHPIPDNTGYITEGQLYLRQGSIVPSASLSRLKQQVIGKVTREDHGDLANTLIWLHAEANRAEERRNTGFKLSRWDHKLLSYNQLFKQNLMRLEVNLSLEEALDMGWRILSKCFEPQEVGIKQAWIDKYWPNL